MSSEDETRVMAISDEVRSFMMGPTPKPDAETPCVGVPSVGDTHFGETQLALEIADTASVRLSTNTASVRSQAPSGPSHPSPRLPGPLRSWPSSRAWIARIPRPAALALGAIVGVGAALLIGLLQDGDGEGRSAPAKSAQVEALVQTDEGAGVPDVPVRVRNQVVLTDEAGRAPFPPVPIDGPLSVKAECPSGYAGARLVREIPQVVAAASTSWSFRLICRPEFADVSMVIETKGCGEVRVWVDGLDRGATKDGSLTLGRRIQSAEVVEVRAEPTSSRCVLDKVRHVTLSPNEKTSTVLFEGMTRRPIARQRKKAPVASARPYRL